MKLYPFQKEIIKEIIAKKGRCILALSMGCGKTVITCSFLKCFKKFPKTLIIIPPILYDSWIKHLRQWVSKDLKIQYIATGNDLVDYTAQVYIVSYQLFTKLYSAIPPVDALIIEEAHMAKNPRSNRTKAIFNYLKHISPQTPIRLLLTGTPITNKPIDLWSLVSIIDPKIFPSFWAFAKRYCNARKTTWGYWDFSGASHLDELKQKIQPILIRRTWDDIQLDNIPPLIKKPIKVGRATTQISELDSQILIMENGLEKERLKAKQRQFVGMQKIKQVADLCLNLLNKTDKVVLFAWHRKVIEGYQEYFKKNKIKAGILYGNLGNKQKIKLINDFRNGKIQVLIINWLSGGVGLNLEFCHVGVFGELDFTPANISQAMMRIFRLTSKHPVFIFFPYLARSYEERIIKILLQKQEIFDKLIKGTKVDQIPFERIGRKIYEKEVKND